jgi:hypothetical protein
MADPQLQWDTQASALSACDVTSVTNTPEGVVLSFGRRQQDAAGALQVERLHQVVLSPAAASGLRQMLARMLADQATGGRS